MSSSAARHSSPVAVANPDRCSFLRPRLVSIRGVDVDAPLGGTMLILANDDRPGVIGPGCKIEAGCQIGEYTVLQDTPWHNVPIGYWTYPDSIQAAWRGFAGTPTKRPLMPYSPSR